MKENMKQVARSGPIFMQPVMQAFDYVSISA